MGFLILFLAFLLAACNRDFESPYLPDSPDYAGPAWSRDSDGDGLADSVEKYAPGCNRGPAPCLSLAQENALTLAGGDTTDPNDDPDDDPDENRILVESVSAPDLRLTVGETKSAQVKVLPANATSRNYELSSKDGSVAVVKPGGIYAVGEGSTTITIHALDGSDKEGRFHVIVDAAEVAVESVRAEDMEFSLVNFQEPLRKTPEIIWIPEDATDKRYTLTSADPDVAKIVGDAVEAGGALGRTTVTVVAGNGNRRSDFRVTVKLLDLCVSDCGDDGGKKGKDKGG